MLYSGHTTLYCIVLRYTVSYYVVSYYIVLYYMVFIVLYYVGLICFIHNTLRSLALFFGERKS